MLNNRILAICIAFSVLFHLLLGAAVSLLPMGSRHDDDVMVVNLTDMPRVPDFLPPRPGIVTGAAPKPEAPVPSPKATRPLPKARPMPPSPPPMTGRVPDLPVNPDLPPEKTFPKPQARVEPPPQREEAGPREPREAPPARPEAGPARDPAEPGTAGRPAEPAGPPGSPASQPGKLPSGKELTPSLGKTVIAMADRGSRGRQETSSGSAVGTGGKAVPKGPIAEEHGGGTRLTALNAPEIQYISYFASIKRKIELVWQYPYEAAAAGIQGELTIDFAVGRDGRIESLELIRGSGSKILDEEAMGAIRKAAPFNPIPPRYTIPQLLIRAHFIYEMHALKLR